MVLLPSGEVNGGLLSSSHSSTTVHGELDKHELPSTLIPSSRDLPCSIDPRRFQKCYTSSLSNAVKQADSGISRLLRRGGRMRSVDDTEVMDLIIHAKVRHTILLIYMFSVWMIALVTQLYL